MRFSLSTPGKKSACVQRSSLENQTHRVGDTLYIFTETCKKPLELLNCFGQWRTSPITCTIRISYKIREVWGNTISSSWWKQMWQSRGLWHFWGCRVASEKGRLISFSTLLCMPLLQVQMHSYIFFSTPCCTDSTTELLPLSNLHHIPWWLVAAQLCSLGAVDMLVGMFFHKERLHQKPELTPLEI